MDPISIGKPEDTSAWIDDSDKRRNLIALLNDCVKQHARERRIGKDEKGRFYFWPVLDRSDSPEDSPAPQTRYYQLPGDAKLRAVAAKKISSTDNSILWVHYAARIRVELLGRTFFLRVEPTYIFTREMVANRWTEKALAACRFNGAANNKIPMFCVRCFSGHMFFQMGGRKSEFLVGGGCLTASIVPAIARTSFGIAGDYIRVSALVQEFDAVR